MIDVRTPKTDEPGFWVLSCKVIASGPYLETMIERTETLTNPHLDPDPDWWTVQLKADRLLRSMHKGGCVVQDPWLDWVAIPV